MKLFQSTILFLALAALASASLNRRGSTEYNPASNDDKAVNESKSNYGYEDDSRGKAAPSGDKKSPYDGGDEGGDEDSKKPCDDRKHGPCRPRGHKDYDAPAPKTPCSSSVLPTSEAKTSTSCTSGKVLPTSEAKPSTTFTSGKALPTNDVPKKPDSGADREQEERVCKTSTVTETKTVPTTVVKTEMQTDYKTRTVEKPVPVVEYKTETKTTEKINTKTVEVYKTATATVTTTKCETKTVPVTETKSLTVTKTDVSTTTCTVTATSTINNTKTVEKTKAVTETVTKTVDHTSKITEYATKTETTTVTKTVAALPDKEERKEDRKNVGYGPVPAPAPAPDKNAGYGQSPSPAPSPPSKGAKPDKEEKSYIPNKNQDSAYGYDGAKDAVGGRADNSY